MYIQKVEKTGDADPAEMGVQKGNSDWEMPNKPEDIKSYKLFEKRNEPLLKAKLKSEKVNENMFKEELEKVSKNVAREVERSQFSTVQLLKTDLCGIGNGLQIHCLTTQDDLTAVCLVNTEYNKNFGKKFLSNVCLEFRESFSFNPNTYLDITED